MCQSNYIKELVLELVVANQENTAKVGWFIGEHKEKSGGSAGMDLSAIALPATNAPKDTLSEKHSSTQSCTSTESNISMEGMNIPFYSTVREGANFDHADWKDQACVRQAVISWREDMSVRWLERHMEMTQGFVCIGSTAPGLFVLGEPTHDREDLGEEARAKPDLTKLKAYIVPPGCGIIIKKGVWHDFPVSCGPALTVFIMNTEEVIEALTSMEKPGEMNHGDCFKLSMVDQFPGVQVRFPDPRSFVVENDLIASPSNKSAKTNAPIGLELTTNGLHGYGHAMVRSEVSPAWGQQEDGSAAVYVVPVVNVEVFLPGQGGPAIQPHLQSQPELANKGWRDSGKKNGLARLKNVFKDLGIPVTAVINSDALDDPETAIILQDAHENAGWELAGHGKNNSEGFANLPSALQEETIAKECLSAFEKTFQKKPTSWLTPGFSVTLNTPDILARNGVTALLDFVDDEVPYQITSEETSSETICIPYSMETNDFSLVLGRHLSPKEYAGAIESHIEQLSDEAKRDGTPKVVCVGMHTFVAGQPGYARELGKAMKRLQEYSSQHIRFATADGVVAAIQENAK